MASDRGVLTPRRRRRVLPGYGLAAISASFIALWAGPARPMLNVGDPAAQFPSVNERSGAATLRIPIQVPPGPGGLKPDVALVYSSQGGDSPYGVGWNLPLGEIRCSTRFGAPDYALCPRFELNGELLTPDPTNPNRYHPLTESFQRIVYSVSGGYWEVTSPSGRKQRFGSSENSRIRAGNAQAPVARWLLDQISDTYGNTISITYLADPLDLGNVYPLSISYAEGNRKVHFVYEARPDTIHDFAGGFERKITQRLREIQIESHQVVFRRRVIGYSQPGEYSTGRSRLTWTQVFGDDCPTSISDPSAGCSGLPRQEFEYTDPNDTLTGASGDQWVDESPGFEPPILEYEGVWPIKKRGAVESGDINGDGLIDFIEAYREGVLGNPGFPYNYRVLINTGSGWVEDTNLTDKLWALEFSVPKMEMASGAACYAVIEDAVTQKVYFDTNNNFWSGRPMFETSDGSDGNYWYHLSGDFYLVDLDADGRADLVMSMRMSGIHESCSGPGYEYIPGRTVQVAFRNTGDGWVEDPSLIVGLPAFGMVVVENPYYLTETYGWIDELNEFAGDNCKDKGLSAPQYDVFYEVEGDLCANQVSFNPTFTDLNGDGRLDLIVANTIDDTAIWVDNTSALPPLPPGSPPWPTTRAPSLSWLNTEQGWIRAPEFDLPISHVTLLQKHRQWWWPGDEFSEFPASVVGDAGVRIADLNRDGHSDIVWTDPGVPLLAKPIDPVDSTAVPVGVLLNRGRGEKDAAGDMIPSSAWCSSVPVAIDLDFDGTPDPNGVGDCSDAAQQFVPPEPFARIGADDQSGGAHTESTGLVADRKNKPGFRLEVR